MSVQGRDAAWLEAEARKLPLRVRWEKPDRDGLDRVVVGKMKGDDWDIEVRLSSRFDQPLCDLYILTAVGRGSSRVVRSQFFGIGNMPADAFDDLLRNARRVLDFVSRA